MKATNDSLEQQKAKKQNLANKNKNNLGNKYTAGPNHPST